MILDVRNAVDEAQRQRRRALEAMVAQAEAEARLAEVAAELERCRSDLAWKVNQ